MYSQSRTNGYNFGESEDAQFKREWKQHKTKICDEEHMHVSRTEKIKTMSKLRQNYSHSIIPIVPHL